MKPSEMDGEKTRTTPPADPADPNDVSSVCESGCKCGMSSSNTQVKIVAGLIVFLAIIGVFAYKASSVQQDSSNAVIAKRDSEPAAAQPVLPEATPASERVAASEPIQGDLEIDELEAFSALDQIAKDKEVVFVFIPGLKNEPAENKINQAMFAAQKTLESKSITLGLYILSTRSSDYRVYSSLVRPPCVYIIVKGKGQAIVSDEVSKAKLLQAYMSVLSNAGRGPRGCGCGG